MAESWPEALVGATRTEAEAAVAARGLHPESAGLRPAFVMRLAGRLRPGTELRVVRARWLAVDRLDLVCGGFLPARAEGPAESTSPASPGASATGPGHAEVRP